MGISPLVPKTILILAGCFLGLRLLGGKSPTDAMRLFGLSLALKILIDNLEKTSLWMEKIGFIVAEQTKAKTLNIFLIFFFYFMLTHAINGLAIHSWQGFDIGFFAQATHNAFSERALMFKNIDGSGSFFAHHFSPFLFILAPIGALRDSPFFLYLIQDAALALTLALIHKRIVVIENASHVSKIMILALVLGNPFWTGIIYYEFHELSFAPLLMFFLLIGWEKQKAGLILAAGLMLLTIKETIFFSMAWFGLWLMIFERKKSIKSAGIALSLSALGLWFLYFKKILPFISSSNESMFINYYGHLGKTMLDVILSPILRPMDFLKAVFNQKNAIYLFLLFASSAPLLVNKKERFWTHLKWLIPVLPDLMIAILSNYSGIKKPGHQYAGLIIVPVMFFIISGYSDWHKWDEKRKKYYLAWAAATSFMFVVINPIRVWRDFFFSRDSGLASRPFVEALQDIKREESIAVSDVRLLPFVARRDNLIWLPKERFSKDQLIGVSWFAFKHESLAIGPEVCADNKKIEWSDYVLCRLNENR